MLRIKYVSLFFGRKLFALIQMKNIRSFYK